MAASVWSEATTVRSHEITPHGTASVPALATYLQEAAGHHAEALGVSFQRLQANEQAWVLVHLHVEIERLPNWEEEVVIETWPSGIDRLYATREFLLRGDDGPVARATSAWLVFDTERRRPARLPERLHSIESPDRAPVLAHDWDDLPHPEHVDHTRSFEVRYHDLDVNRHVNNVRVLEWALETLPADIHESYRCAGVALQFVAETRPGDTVRGTVQVDEEESTLHARHALQHATDDRTLAVAATEWAPRT